MAEVLVDFACIFFPSIIHFPFKLWQVQGGGGLFCNPAREYRSSIRVLNQRGRPMLKEPTTKRNM